MDVATAGAVVSAIYPVLQDIISFVFKRRGSLHNSEGFRNQVKEMVTVVQSDISQIKAKIDNIREVIAGMDVPTGEIGRTPWQVPPDAKGVNAWLYRRRARQLRSSAEEFRNSVDGIIDIISCCAGVMEGTVAIQSPNEQTRNPDWANDLARSYEEIIEKLGYPSKYSIDDLTNEMDRFLDQSKIALQKLARSV